MYTVLVQTFGDFEVKRSLTSTVCCAVVGGRQGLILLLVALMIEMGLGSCGQVNTWRLAQGREVGAPSSTQDNYSVNTVT